MRTIETLEQFMERVKQFTGRQYLFRGVSSECYKLEAPVLDVKTPIKGSCKVQSSNSAEVIR